MTAARPKPSKPELRWHRTTLDGRGAAYGEAGEGAPVVFIHGWGLSSRTYARVFPAIARAGGRVIAPALPGFGKSDPLPGTYTWEKLAHWVAELLEHAGVDEPAHFIGHSFGGGVSTAVAWYRPEVVRSIVLVNSIGGSVWKDSTKGVRSLADRPLWDWGLHLPSEFTQRSYARVFPVVARDFLMNALTNLSALRRAAHLARSADLRDELAELAERGLPVSILWGNQDRVVPEATFLAMCEAAGAPGDIIEDAGHSWLLTDPEGFGELMTNSLTIHSLLARRTGTSPIAPDTSGSDVTSDPAA